MPGSWVSAQDALETRDCRQYACTEQADGPDGYCRDHRRRQMPRKSPIKPETLHEIASGLQAGATLREVLRDGDYWQALGYTSIESAAVSIGQQIKRLGVTSDSDSSNEDGKEEVREADERSDSLRELAAELEVAVEIRDKALDALGKATREFEVARDLVTDRFEAFALRVNN